ncbi:MAG: DUF3365 domain-containing protein [Pseudomonadales bacterium]|nr:DUF3365 domain-containing protein [Pseudomonadales bacterium]MCP5356659.1 DUF3365 domain-containing protein [Pseudomonadales bacterium]
MPLYRLLPGILVLPCILLACAPVPPAAEAPAQPAPVPLPPTLASNPGMPQFAPTDLVNEASALTQRFVGTLLPTLQGAIAVGGPVGAIDVCAVEAPRIAQVLSEESGWEVKRVSLKARNSSMATPDGWETQVLNVFDLRQRSGEPPATLNVAEVVNGRFRYMQAQPTMPLCLTCHGSNISPEVSSALARKYPNDKATGYQEGQIRGAISLSKQM